MKSSRHAVVAALLIASNGLLAPSLTFGGADVVTSEAPPPNRVEHAPPPREGYVWGPGHWEWSGHTYTWISGSWVVEHRGAHFVADRWEQDGAQWRDVKGHWER